MRVPVSTLLGLGLAGMVGLARQYADAADTLVSCPVSNGTLPNPISCRCGNPLNRSCTAHAGTFCFADHALCTTRPNMRRRPPAIVFEVGSCAESNGRSLINSTAECGAAALELDITDSNVTAHIATCPPDACPTHDKKVYFNALANPAPTGRCAL